MVDYNMLLFSLSDFRYRMNNHEELSDDIRLIALQLHLSKTMRKRYKRIYEEIHEKYKLSHTLAARSIQLYFRLHRSHKSGNRQDNMVRSTINTWTSLRPKPSPRLDWDSNQIDNLSTDSSFDEDQDPNDNDSDTDDHTDDERNEFFDSRYRSHSMSLDVSKQDTLDMA